MFRYPQIIYYSLSIYAKPNHLPFIVKQLPKMVNKRISDLYCDESAFNNARVIYELALKQSGHNSKMKFERQPTTRINRIRQIIWITLRLVKTLRLTLENSFSN